MTSAFLGPDEVRELWPGLDVAERLRLLDMIGRADAHELFLEMPSFDQYSLLSAMPVQARRGWLRLVAPDDLADVIQQVDLDERTAWLELIEEPTRSEVSALLAYADDAAGGLMSPRFARLRPEMRVDEAIHYLRRQASGAQLETIYYAYVLDQEQRIVGLVSFRDLFRAPGDRPLDRVMRKDVVSVRDDLDEEAVAQIFRERGFHALPVVDADGRMKGIVTMDDVVGVVDRAATEDMQKIGGMEALDGPYFQTGFLAMLKKRAGWLAILFLGEMLTATAMGAYQDELAKALVLSAFIPLIISSGGNSGSQATTLIIRAMALGEVSLADWWRVARRELATGLGLGVILALLGSVRILVWQAAGDVYGPRYLELALTISLSLVGVVLWGTVIGSMLPFIIRRFGADPASASAPFVATIVDVTGLVIYFTIAQLIFSGNLV